MTSSTLAKKASGGIASDWQIVPEPLPYDVHNWQSFQDDVLRYHATKFPEANRVDDRIYTFRRFMMPGVIQYLRNKRPGIFEIGEFDDWNQWLASTTALLNARDSSIPGALENRVDDVAESWAMRYQDGNMSEKELWFELKALVDKRAISIERQLEVF